MPRINGSGQEHSEHILALCRLRQVMEICTEILGMVKRGSECGEKGEEVLSCAFCRSVVTVCKFLLLSQQLFWEYKVTVNEKQHRQMCCWVSYRS